MPNAGSEGQQFLKRSSASDRGGHRNKHDYIAGLDS
jgi:hypothetical protein